MRSLCLPVRVVDQCGHCTAIRPGIDGDFMGFPWQPPFEFALQKKGSVLLRCCVESLFCVVACVIFCWQSLFRLFFVLLCLAESLVVNLGSFY
jgi:hypothetical protein